MTRRALTAGSSLALIVVGTFLVAYAASLGSIAGIAISGIPLTIGAGLLASLAVPPDDDDDRACIVCHRAPVDDAWAPACSLRCYQSHLEERMGTLRPGTRRIARQTWRA